MYTMKKARMIWMMALMVMFVAFGANVAMSDAPAADQPAASTEEKDINQGDLGAGVDCPPTGQSGSPQNLDEAVGNDSPVTRQDSPKNEKEPCPPQSVQPNDSINQGSGDKGGATDPNAAPDINAGPDNHVK
jgi:hypothetical protein